MQARSLAWLTSTLIALGAVPARAQDPLKDTGGGPARNFGGAGQIAFLSDASFVVEHASNDVTNVEFAPGADVFVIENLSVGGFLATKYSEVKGAHSLRLSFGPRIGYNYALTNLLSVWPKFGLGFAHTSTGYEVSEADLSTSASTTNNALALSLFVPVMFHPVTHFFVGLGPYLDADLSGDHRVVAYGLRFTLGGWLG